jgi:hypothetical protein
MVWLVCKEHYQLAHGWLGSRVPHDGFKALIYKYHQITGDYIGNHLFQIFRDYSQTLFLKSYILYFLSLL